MPERPRSDVPVVLDGAVFAHAQVGNRIFVGGDFTRVQDTNGNVLNQRYIFAYDINSGQFDQNFRPNLNNDVRALEARTGNDGLYVGGSFTQWDGNNTNRVARLSSQGNLDTGFAAQTTGRVRSLVDVGGSLYLGGDFLNVSGLNVTGLARVNRNSGVVDQSWAPRFTNSVNGGNLVRAIDETPDGNSLFVLHFALQVEGQDREAVAKFNIGNATPTLSGWNIPFLEQGRDCLDRLRDIAISPNGSFLVIGGQGNDFPPNCDSVTRYPTAGNGTVNFDWAARMYSSVFSLAVSDRAVYVGGHFCAAPRNGAPPGGVAGGTEGTFFRCFDDDNPALLDPANAVARDQMAALNPNNGQALPWDPGSNNLVAVFDLTLIDRGLLAGHDANRFNNIQTGRSGFFDFSPPNNGGGNNPAPAPTPVEDLSCSASVNNAGNVVLDWDPVPGESSYSVRDNDGFVATVNNGTAFTDTNPTAGTRRYEIRFRANGQNIDFNCNPQVTVAGAPAPAPAPGNFSCSASVNNAGNVVLDWDPVPGESSYSVRDNDGFVATVNNGTAFTDTNPTAGTRRYEIRFRANGQNIDFNCNPQVTVAGAPTPTPTPGNLSCSASVNNAGNVVLDWDPVPGESSYVVRDNSGFVATVNNATAFVDTNPGAGNQRYVIRYRANGQNNDFNCNPLVNAN